MILICEFVMPKRLNFDEMKLYANFYYNNNSSDLVLKCHELNINR